MTREATILRETAETRIEVTVNLDGADARTWQAASGSSTTCCAPSRVTAASI